MLEARGNLWDFHAQGYWVGINTNGIVRRDGRLVMGRGVAKQAALRFPDLPWSLGTAVSFGGNHVYPYPKYRVTSFPTKRHWQDAACLQLIVQSAEELMGRVIGAASAVAGPVYLPRPGCGLGGLEWTDVKPELEKILDDNVVIVTW